MRPILLFLTATPFFINTSAQTWCSDCSPTGNSTWIYRNDAYLQALGRVFAINSPYKDSVELPEQCIDSMARVFYAVHNMQPSPVKDTLINFFGFSHFNTSLGFLGEDDSCHAFGGYFYQRIKAIDVRVDTNQVWVKQWRAKNYYNTVNTDINALMSRYDITIDTLYIPIVNQYGEALFRLETGRALNTIALANLFKTVAGVIDANAQYRVSLFVESRITVTPNTNGAQIDYVQTCGDGAPQINWSLQVNTNTNCSVNFISRETGEPEMPTCSRGPVITLTTGCNAYPDSLPMCATGNATFSVPTASSYQWQESTDKITFHNLTNSSPYSGVNTNTLSIANVPSNWYGREYRCITDNSYSRVTELKIRNQWTGSVSTAWEDAGNWSCGVVPDQYTDVRILSGSTVVVNSNVSVGALYLFPGGNLTVNPPFTLTVVGH